MSLSKKKAYKIGLTGGIACGKSLVRKIIDKYDIPSIDADEIVHDILKNDKDIIKKITEIFGTSFLNEDGSINRKNLAKLVFTEPSKLKELESIIHPQTNRIIKNFLNDNINDIVVVVIPLLFENNRQHLFDSVWLVTAKENQQIERLKLRDNMSEEEAKQRIASQMPQETKIALADVIINNSESIEELEIQISQLINRIRTN